MPQWYTVVDQSPATQILGPNDILNGQRVEFVTKPTGIYAQRIVPMDKWLAGDTEGWISPLAEAIENMIAGGLASYATWIQTVEPGSHLLADSISFVVTYDPGDGRPVMSAEANVPVASLTVDTQFGGVLASYFGGGASSLDPQQTVRDVYDRLVATAAP
jgi:hypothetical protein